MVDPNASTDGAGNMTGRLLYDPRGNRADAGETWSIFERADVQFQHGRHASSVTRFDHKYPGSQQYGWRIASRLGLLRWDRMAVEVK
jgi:hypothetical protein